MLTCRKVKILNVFTFLFFFLSISVKAFGVDVEIGVENKDKKQVFYNEKKDCENGECRKSKNYAKIGAEEYSQKKVFRKLYFGVDVNWELWRFGDTEYFEFSRSRNSSKKNVEVNPTMYSKELFSRLKDFDVYFGFRMFKYFAMDIGYAGFYNIFSKNVREEFIETNGSSYDMHGIFADAILYTPAIHIKKITSIEGYASVGGVAFLTRLNDYKGIFGAKFGAGILIQVYSSFAVNVGVDYYYPLKEFSNKGLLAVKTGLNFYINV